MAVAVGSPDLQLIHYVMSGIDLSAAAVQGKNIPLAAFPRRLRAAQTYLEITAQTGVLLAGCSLRAGNDGGKVNLFPIAALATGVLGLNASPDIPLNALVTMLDLSIPISVEVTIGATFVAGGTLVGSLHLIGHYAS